MPLRHKPAASVPAQSPCPLCGEMMETPAIDLITRKATKTRCAKCGTTRTLLLADDQRTWN